MSGLSTKKAMAEAWASPASAVDSSSQSPKPRAPAAAASSIRSGATAASSDRVVSWLRASSEATSSSISTAVRPSVWSAVRVSRVTGPNSARAVSSSEATTSSKAVGRSPGLGSWAASLKAAAPRSPTLISCSLQTGVSPLQPIP